MFWLHTFPNSKFQASSHLQWLYRPVCAGLCRKNRIQVFSCQTRLCICSTDALDTLDERLNSFFKKCIQPNVKTEWKDEQFAKIKQVQFNVVYNVMNSVSSGSRLC